MTAIVPDTLQGALIVSVIDFFLSFVIISGIGLILGLFPLLNRAGRYLVGQPHSGVTASEKRGLAERNGGSAKHRQHNADDDDVAAIAAAVLVAIDGVPHRILHIEPSHSGWVAEGRLAHHASHLPSRP